MSAVGDALTGMRLIINPQNTFFGWSMTEKEKEEILRKMKNREQGDVASNDDDLVRSEKYMKKGQYARSKYKEFYDDVKLSIKEDW